MYRYQIFSIKSLIYCLDDKEDKEASLAVSVSARANKPNKAKITNPIMISFISLSSGLVPFGHFINTLFLKMFPLTATISLKYIVFYLVTLN